MTDWKMREAETARKVAAANRRRELREAQADLADDLVGGAGHRVPVGWDRDPLMRLPNRRKARAKAQAGGG